MPTFSLKKDIFTYRFDNGPDTLMPPVPSSPFKTKPSEGKVQIVMNDD